MCAVCQENYVSCDLHTLCAKRSTYPVFVVYECVKYVLCLVCPECEECMTSVSGVFCLRRNMLCEFHVSVCVEDGVSCVSCLECAKDCVNHICFVLSEEKFVPCFGSP